MSINPDLYDSIVCFGDSLVQQAEEKGFVAKLRTAYERKLDSEFFRISYLVPSSRGL